MFIQNRAGGGPLPTYLHIPSLVKVGNQGGLTAQCCAVFQNGTISLLPGGKWHVFETKGSPLWFQKHAKGMPFPSARGGKWHTFGMFLKPKGGPLGFKNMPFASWQEGNGPILKDCAALRGQPPLIANLHQRGYVEVCG